MGRTAEHELLTATWAALGGDEGAPATLDVQREAAVPDGPRPVENLLVAAAGSTLLAAADLAQARTGRSPEPGLDVDGLLVAAASERHVRLDGEPVGTGVFDPLSAFMPAADGWVRLHGNYPWHRAAAVRALAVSEPAQVPAAVAGLPALAVEELVVAEGGCAAAVRDDATWAATPMGVAAASHGLVAWANGPTSTTPLRPPSGVGASLPAAGLRVVDLTRVIAGPVGTRMLSALGADVVRVSFPHRLELELLVLDGGRKRWAPLDLRTSDGRAELERLLAAADVVVTGHRPGALDAFGLSPAALADHHPHLVCVSLSAWGSTGPWAGRRGFDSLVQAATGIAERVRPATRAQAPGALPVQALDHATGYLIAAAALRGLAIRARTGAAPRARLALAATAHALLELGPGLGAAMAHVDPEPYLVELDHARGRLRVARPPGALDGRALHWPAAG